VGVRPNLVVGAFGAVVFLLTGTIIVQNWRGLTDTHDYEVLVDEDTTSLGQRSSSMGSGSTRTETFRITHANVTRVQLRLIWDESSVTGAQHDVTLSLTDPKNAPVAQATGRGGVAGLSIDQTLGPTPPGGRFSTRSGNAEAEFASEYPPHPETAGTWIATIKTNQPAQPGATGITYRLTFEITHYTATFREAAPLQK
jgi:hypothetical protein